MARDQLVETIRHIYDCATDAACWPTCLTSVGALLSGTSVNLLYHDLRSKGGIQLAIGADPELYRLYSDYGHGIDPWALACRPAGIPAGGVVIGASLVDYGRVRKTEFYADMGRRFEATHALIGMLEASAHQSAVLTINRGDRGEEFDAGDARLLSILVPHFRRALSIQRRLGRLEEERASVVSGLDRLPLGLVLFDSRARPIFLNRYASKLLEQRDGLSVEKDAMVAAAPAANTRLAAALGSAISVTLGYAFTAENGDLLIPRSLGRRALHVSVSSTSPANNFAPLGTRAAALMFLVDPDLVSAPLNDRLRELFLLTPAEARVAGALAAGLDVADISDQLGVSRETVRAQVKRLFEKAGVRSQSAFVRVVATESIRLVRLRSEG